MLPFYPRDGLVDIGQDSPLEEVLSVALFDNAAEYISIESSQGIASTGELPVPMIAVVIVIAILVIGMIAYSWKKR